MLLEFSSFISVKYVICFLQKYNGVTVTLNCVITEKNLYLNLLVTYQIFLCVTIKFHQVLQWFLLSNGWIIFSRLNTIKKQKIVSCSSSLILRAVNFLLRKKIITVSRPTTLRIFPMGRSGYPTKGANWGGGGSPCKSKSSYFPLLLEKNITYWEIPHIWEKCISNSFQVKFNKKFACRVPSVTKL